MEEQKPFSAEDYEKIKAMMLQRSSPIPYLSIAEWFEVLQNPEPIPTIPPHEVKRFDRTNLTRRKGKGKRSGQPQT